MTGFTLDTNILINLEVRYPRDVFPSAWEALEDLIDDGRACICSEVHEETRRGRDDLYDWAKGYEGFVCETTRPELELVANISNEFPDWVRARENAADPFLIAHARVDNLVVVTDERRAGSNVSSRNQKVPNVADTLNVATINFIELAREETWRF